MDQSKQKTIGIIGGGAAGFFAAIRAAENSPTTVLLLEGTRRPLTKVKISGGGRCNVTHACFDPKILRQSYPRGGRELLGPLSRFQPRDTIDWFGERGVRLLTEEDGRMFPTTHSSQTIIDTLMLAANQAGVCLELGALVRHIELRKNRFHLTCPKRTHIVDQLILTTGPAGFNLAAGLGHRIVEPKPSLFSFCIEDPLLHDLAGQSFKTCRFLLKVGKKKFSSTGPALVTHWGLSGPAILRLSSFAARELHDEAYRAELFADFAPDLKLHELEQELLDAKSHCSAKAILNTPLLGLSKRFWQRFLKIHAVDPESTWHHLSKKNMTELATRLKSYPLKVDGKGEFKSEFVTAGGVDLKEVEMKTMESKLIPGLFFAGEVLNIDGITGGFNFQNAWTTGWIAGFHAAQNLRSRPLKD